MQSRRFLSASPRFLFAAGHRSMNRDIFTDTLSPCQHKWALPNRRVSRRHLVLSKAKQSDTAEATKSTLETVVLSKAKQSDIAEAIKSTLETIVLSKAKQSDVAEATKSTLETFREWGAQMSTEQMSMHVCWLEQQLEIRKEMKELAVKHHCVQFLDEEIVPAVDGYLWNILQLFQGLLPDDYIKQDRYASFVQPMLTLKEGLGQSAVSHESNTMTTPTIAVLSVIQDRLDLPFELDITKLRTDCSGHWTLNPETICIAKPRERTHTFIGATRLKVSASEKKTPAKAMAHFHKKIRNHSFSEKFKEDFKELEKARRDVHDRYKFDDPAIMSKHALLKNCTSLQGAEFKAYTFPNRNKKSAEHKDPCFRCGQNLGGLNALTPGCSMKKDRPMDGRSGDGWWCAEDEILNNCQKREIEVVARLVRHIFMQAVEKMTLPYEQDDTLDGGSGEK